jgi:hypothetical protein
VTIDPIRGTVGAFDLSCNKCGIVRRLENVRYGQILPKVRAIGWRVEAGRHYCAECAGERAA